MSLLKISRRGESVSKVVSLFSIPLSDKEFEFNSTALPAIKEFAEEKGIFLDEINICLYTKEICEKDPTSHKYNSSTHFEIFKLGNKHIAILFLSNILENGRITEIIEQNPIK